MSESGMANPGSAMARIEGGAEVWRTSRRSIDVSRPVLMGILNVTPDSFSDGGRYFDPDDAVAQAERMIEQGADIVDVGGESTRPGSAPVKEDEELRRIVPVIEGLTKRLDCPVSVDTSKSTVARRALELGAEIINDISGLRFDPGIGDLAAATGAGLVLMHIRGRPRTMQQDVHYDDLMGEIAAELERSVRQALTAGCRHEQLVVDPGIGFGKTAEHNLVIIDELERIARLGYPVLMGPSRKSFIGTTLGLDVGERVEASTAACVVGLLRGARIFRVHDVVEARRALDMAQAITRRKKRGESS